MTHERRTVIGQTLAEPRIAGVGTPWYLRKTGTRRIPGGQDYRCKCGWEGKHHAHTDHVAAMIDAALRVGREEEEAVTDFVLLPKRRD